MLSFTWVDLPRVSTWLELPRGTCQDLPHGITSVFPGKGTNDREATAMAEHVTRVSFFQSSGISTRGTHQRTQRHVAIGGGTIAGTLRSEGGAGGGGRGVEVLPRVTEDLRERAEGGERGERSGRGETGERVVPGERGEGGEGGEGGVGGDCHTLERVLGSFPSVSGDAGGKETRKKIVFGKDDKGKVRKKLTPKMIGKGHVSSTTWRREEIEEERSPVQRERKGVVMGGGGVGVKQKVTGGNGRERVGARERGGLREREGDEGGVEGGRRGGQRERNLVYAIMSELESLPAGADVTAVMGQKGQKLCGEDLATLMAKQKGWQRAMKIFEWMQKNDRAERNMLVLAKLMRILGDSGKWKIVDSILQTLETNNQPPSDSVYEAVILCRVRSMRVDLGLQVFDRMVGLGVDPGVKIYTTLMTGLQNSQESKEAALKTVALAERVLVQMNTQGIKYSVPYNCMLNIYLKANLHGKAIQLLKEMEELNVAMDIYTFHAALRVFGQSGNVDAAADLFNWISNRHEYKPSEALVTYTIMVGIYGKAQRMEDAINLLHEMHSRGIKPDIVLYNTLLSSLGSAHMLHDVAQLYKELKESGPSPNLRTYANMVMAFGRGRKLDIVADVLKDMRISGGKADQAFVEAVLKACCCSMRNWKCVDMCLTELRKLGWKPTAQDLKVLMPSYHKEHNMPEEMLRISKELHDAKVSLDEISWRAILSYHFYRGRLEEMREAFEGMKGDGHIPAKGTLTMLMDLYGQMGRVEEAEKVYEEIKERGFQPDLVCHETLLNCYSLAGKWREAEGVVEKMKEGGGEMTLKAWTLLLRAYQRGGEEERVLPAYQQMKETGVRLDEIGYNTVLNTCGRALPLEEALLCYRAMQAEGYVPSDVTHNVVLSMLIRNDFRAEAEMLFERLRTQNSIDCVTLSTMADMYGKGRDLERMEGVVGEGRERGVELSVSVYNAMVDAYGKAREYEKMEETVGRMEREGFRPDLSTFNSMVHAYGMGNMALEMEQVLERQKMAGLQRDIWTYNILIGVYGELQMPFASVKILRDMQDAGLSPDRITFCNLISAFRRSGDYLEAARWSLWMKQAGFQPVPEPSDLEDEDDAFYTWT